MAAAILHNGQQIFGSFGEVVPEAPQLATSRVQFAGVQGVSEIVGGRGGRAIEIECWLHGGYATAAALRSELARLERLVGSNGPLTVPIGNETMTFNDCTFEGFVQLPGTSPLNDVVGMLGGWFVRGHLRFWQNSVEN